MFVFLLYNSVTKASEGSRNYDFVLGPSFASSSSRSYGLRVGLERVVRDHFALNHGVFLGGYVGGQRFMTADVTIGVSSSALTNLYGGVGLRFSSSTNNPLQLFLGSSLGYVSGELRRYQTKTGAQLEGVISFKIPIRLFI
jgi:hypothetical protein